MEIKQPMNNNLSGKKYYKALLTLFSVALWILLWQLIHILIGYDFLLPSVPDTMKAFFKLSFTALFWKTVLLSLTRIMIGLLLGITLGCAFALVSVYVPILDSFISIGMSIIKSTPVASIVILLWVLIEGTNLPIVIALMMVAPIIWQNLKDAYNSVDKNLYEVSIAFEFSRLKRFRHVFLPTIKGYFIPAVLTSVGLAWKSGIAAEIIAYTRNSIGKYIKDAKDSIETAEMFAWTLTVIVISLALERGIKLLLRRFKSDGIKA